MDANRTSEKLVDPESLALAEHFLQPPHHHPTEARVMQLAAAIQSAVEDFFDYPAPQCPRCGLEDTDMDGFGFTACSACAYCSHPSYNDGKCGICGEQRP